MLCYLPVPHEGFRQLFNRHKSADILLLSKEFIKTVDPEIAERMHRNFNALPALDVQCMLKGWLPSHRVEIIGALSDLREFDEVIIPEGDICTLLEPLIMSMGIVVQKETIFLMWDWSTIMAKKTVEVDTETTTCSLHRELMRQAESYKDQSSDWWRHVAALLCSTSGEQIFGFNEHMPDVYTPYVNGDPRANLNAGESPDICTAIHAEVSAITSAAREGIKTLNAELYVTTFPCHNCARAIVKAGIKTVYFKEGYSSLDAQQILEHGGIRFVKVLFD